MAHVFISYSSTDRVLTEELASHLDACGLDVWWDRELAARSRFDTQIQEQLRIAGCVIVIWTDGAAQSPWVQAEAAYALAHGKIINARADDFDPDGIPDDFRSIDAHRSRAERDLILRDVLAIRQGRLLLEDKRDALPPSGERTPAMLLQAKFGVVGFVSHASLREDLIDWSMSRGAFEHQGGRRGAGLLIHGPGGLGKTRLLIEIADSLRSQGWSAGFLARPDDVADAATRQRRTSALNELIRGANDRGLLLVMDYAEGRNAEIADLARRILARPAHEQRPIRLVLLSRGVETWWRRLIEDYPEAQALFGDGQGGVVARPLPGLATRRDRLELFVEAIRALKPKLEEDGYEMPTSDPDLARLKRLEDGDGYERPLAIVMEALLYLAASAPGRDEASVHGLLNQVLGLERSHWRKLVGPLQADGARDPDLDLRRAVAQVTAQQGIGTRPAAEQLFMADRYYDGSRTSPSSVREVTDNIMRIYGRGWAIAHLEPDLVGEHHVALNADTALLDGNVAWIAGASSTEQAGLRRHLLTVLQRATRPEHGPHARERAIALLDHLILTHGAEFASEIVAVMGDTPGALFDRLGQQIETLSDDLVWALNFELPLDHVEWMDFSLAVAARFMAASQDLLLRLQDVEVHELRVAALARYAAAQGRLSLRLAKLGHHVEALAASEQALEIRRILAEHPGFLADLSSTLNNHSIVLGKLGRHSDAMAASMEAVDIRRRLAAEDPAYLPNLSTSLSNLCTDLSHFGRYDEALAVSLEALDINARLAESDPAAYRRDLAISLSNVGAQRSHLGQRDDALVCTERALAIYRGLADETPELYRANLAMVLMNYGNKLGDVGRTKDAVAASREAVEIMQDLASIRPDAFLPDLANALNNLGMAVSKVGDTKAAVAHSHASLQIYRELATRTPETYLPLLARGLSNLGAVLGELGMGREMLRTCEESVAIYRELATVTPDVHLIDLASGLTNLNVCYDKLGRRDDALAASREALDIYRSLAARQPHAHLPSLSTALNNFATDLSSHGLHEEALTAAREAVDINRQLAQDLPQAFLPKLASSLVNADLTLTNLGRPVDGLVFTREAVDIYRQLAHEMPAAHTRELAVSLTNFGLQLSRTGQHPEAADVAREAVEIKRHLARTNPAAYDGSLATSLNNLASDLRRIGRSDEAIAASEEAIAIFRRLAEHEPAKNAPILAQCLGAFAQILESVGRHGDAVTCTREALVVILPFLTQHPKAFATLAQNLAREHYLYCTRAAVEPDMELLGEIGQAIAGANPALAALQAKITAIAEDAERTGILDEQALAELPTPMAAQLRAVFAQLSMQ